MKIILPFLLAIFLLHDATESGAQTCNGTPTVSGPSHTNITSTTATLGGNVTDDGDPNCDAIETGIDWSTTAGGPYTRVAGSEVGTGTFVVNVTGFTPGTRIYYRAYAKNDNNNAVNAIAYSTEANFYTLATEPAAHAASLTATAVNNDEILLQFPAASTISNADGYVILMRASSAVSLTGLDDGGVASGATDFHHLLNNDADTDYTVTGLNPNATYHFAIIPYNRAGNDNTYNYLTTAGYPTANATTAADVDVNSITGGLAATGSPLNSASTNQALVGFALDASGPVTFQSVVIHLSSTTAGKLSNFRLCESSNSSFDGIATDSPLAGVTITPSASAITIVLSEALVAATDRHFFLVADVDPTVNATTPSVQFSYDETDFTFTPDYLSGTGSQSRTYTFADATPPSVVSTVPADNATGVDLSLDKLTLTFNENVAHIATAAGIPQDYVGLYKSGSGTLVLAIPRQNLTDVGGTGIEIDISSVTLEANTNYYVVAGNAVLEDVPAGNNWGGSADPTFWNFTTSSVTVNNAISNICSGSFQSIGNIVISEGGQGDFNTGASQTLILGLADDNEFVFSNSGVSVSGLSADVTNLSVSVGLTTLTITYTIAGASVIDNITVSGLKVYATGGAANTTIIRTGGDADQDGNNGTGAGTSLTHATINVGATAPAQPQLDAAQDLIHCVNEDITAKTISLVDQGAVTYNWYSDASLSTLETSTANRAVNLVSDLNMASPAVGGTYTFYVVTVAACQSAPPVEVTLQVSANPVANAGTDRTGASAVCTGTALTLGGNPTLATPSAPGAYTYSWNYLEGSPEPNAEANPFYTVTNASTTATATYTFEVTITDANGCTGTDAAIVEVKPMFDILLISPNSYSFTPNSPNQTLDAIPAGGVFSGIGVVQSNAGTYQFSPTIAHATDPNTMPKNFDVYYTVTQDGCTQNNYQVATFTISNSFFSTLQPEYCSNEYPNPATAGVLLSVDANGHTLINNRMNSWNSSERFSRGPYNNPWQAGLLYSQDSYVRYNNEIYRCDGGLLGCMGFVPPDGDNAWKNENLLKVKFNGYIANYYEDYYGGNPAPTIVKVAGSTYTVDSKTYNHYRFGTNVNYNNCPSCNYAWPGAYLVFENPEDVRKMLPQWNASYNYYINYLLTYNNRVYRALIDYPAVGVSPDSNPAQWADVTDTDYGNGQYFHKKDLATNLFVSGYYVSGQYVRINRNPTVFFSGLANGQDVCRFDVLDVDNAASSAGITYDLTGNFSNQNLTQEFLVRLDGAAVFNTGAGTITNDIINPGKATFDTKNAFLNSPGGSPDFKNIEIQYKVDPGTDGSTSQPCYGTSSIIVQVLQNSTFDFDNTVDPEGSIYCYNEVAKGLRAENEADLLITGTAGTPNSIVYSGYGINDLGNSRAVFNPGVAIDQISSGTTVQQSIPITAVFRDPNQCRSVRVRTFKVNPDIEPSFTFGGRVNYCYEDIANPFTGHFEDFTHNATTVTSTGRYDFVFRDPANNLYTLETVSSNNTTFTAKTFYDEIQTYLNTQGFTADLNQTANINVIYTERLNAGKVCTESFVQPIVINPPATLDIFGLASGDILCRNDNNNISQGQLVSFEGSVSGLGSFKLDDDDDFSAVNATLNGTVNSASGKATINLLSAYNASTSATEVRKVYLQYIYSAPGCTGPANTIKDFDISPPPALTFDFNNSPGNNEVFCYDEVPVSLKTDQNANVTITGFGISDSGTGDGTAIFNPELAFNTSVSNGGSLAAQQNIGITARIVDGVGCVNFNTIQYKVNPIPVATLNTGSLYYCYEDDPRTITGNQTNSWFSMEYQGVATPYSENIGSIGAPQSNLMFNPRTRFDHAEQLGASALTPVDFHVYYTVADNNQCTNTVGPYIISVANQIDVSIAGLDNDDVFCSNESNGIKVLSFNPFPADASKREFTINDGPPIPLTTQKYSFNPGLPGGDFRLKYVVISGNDCTNTDTVEVRVLPSPEAIFSVQPACDSALIAYNADAANNLSSALYTWTLSDSVRTGQNLQHRFPGVSTYSVQLEVTYPAYNNDPNLVCRDSLRLDQIVGPVPQMDFSYFNVCEADETSFVADPDIPISTVSWDFDDGETTAQGFLASPVPATLTTSGTFGSPNHKYAGAGNYVVTVIGKTAEIFGGCADTLSREVAILKNWSPTAAEPYYQMASLDGGKGFWVKEDVTGNSTWEFNAATKTRMTTNEMAWVTGATTPYKPGDVSFMNSPCFDLSAFTRPVLSMKHWTDTELSDGAVMQYSTDGGQTWQRLGNVASGLDWYNRLTISSNPGEQTDLSSGWSTTDQREWAVGKHTLDVITGPRNQVRFRVAFSSFNNREGRDGFAFNDVVIEERNRTILVENFTNLQQTANNNNFIDFRAANKVFNTSELVKLQYHHTSERNSAPADQLNEDNPIDPNARAAFYGVTNAVRAFIDGGYGQTSSNATFGTTEIPAPLQNYFSLRSLVTAPVEIAIDFDSQPSDKLNVKATIQATNEVGNPGEYSVFIAIAEQEVMDQVYVLRKFLPDASGTPLTSLSATDPAQEITASYDMRHVTRLPDGSFAPFAVIVFVQHLETKDVLQTVMRQDGTASPEIVTGVETAFDNFIKLYPNPADAQLNIILPSPVAESTPVSLFDAFGKAVYQGTLQPGEHVKTIASKSFSAGVYLIQLSTPQGTIRKKLMIVHE